MTLKVINGGKTSGSGASGPAGAFKEHPLAEALFDALHTKDARTLEQIRARMSKPNHYVTRAQANSAIRHNRDHIAEYGWMVAFVQKGRGAKRLYWLQDGDKRVTADHKEAFDAATKSTLRGLATTIEHYDAQVSMIADTDGLSRGERRKYNKLAGDTAAIATLVQDLLARA